MTGTNAPRGDHSISYNIMLKPFSPETEGQDKEKENTEGTEKKEQTDDTVQK